MFVSKGLFIRSIDMTVLARLQQNLLPGQGTKGTEFLLPLFEEFFDLFPAGQDANWLAWVKIRKHYMGEIQGFLDDPKSSETFRARLLVAVNLPLEWSVVPWRGYRDLIVHPKEVLSWKMSPRLKDFMLNFIIAVIAELRARPLTFEWNYDPLFVFNRRILGFLSILGVADIDRIMSYFSIQERELYLSYDVYQPFWIMMCHPNVPEKWKMGGDKKMRSHFEQIRPQIIHSSDFVHYCQLVFQNHRERSYGTELWKSQLRFVLTFPYRPTLISLHYLSETIKDLIAEDKGLCQNLVSWAVLSDQFEWRRRKLFSTVSSQIIQLDELISPLYGSDSKLA